MNGTDDQYIWISRWEEFQHYAPNPERGPAWIKNYTAQLSDERYLDLTDRQRALLHDVRAVFAVTRGRLSRSTAVVSRHRHRQTFRSDLDALNDAGLIEFCSREVLEQRLEMFYSRSRTRSRSREKYIAATPLSTSDNGSEPAPKKARKPRAPDPVWDACVEVFGDVANDAERGRRAKAVQLFKQALESGGTALDQAADEIRARRERYLAVFEHLPKPSAVALANHWTECKPLPQTLSTRRY